MASHAAGRLVHVVCFALVWLTGVLLALGVIGSVSNFAAKAQGLGNLLVAPKRIIFEGRQRSAQVTLMNTGSSTATYRISFKNMRMTEDGRLENIDEPEPGQLFADKWIRYAPRQVVLEPGVSQTVRLLVRKQRSLPPGEYRSHLQFLAVPEASGEKDVEALDLEEGEIRVQIKVIFGISIPVLIRQGDNATTVKMSDLVIEASARPEASANLVLRLERSGNRSVSGTLEAIFTPGNGKDRITVGQQGAAVLSPLRSRSVAVPLVPPDGVVLEHGVLQVIYRTRAEDGGTVLAKAELALP